jgi:hypothetical protein
MKGGRNYFCLRIFAYVLTLALRVYPTHLDKLEGFNTRK